MNETHSPRSLGEGPALPRWTFAVLALLIFSYVLLLSAGASSGAWLVVPGGRPARTDFAEFWGAGRLALEGRAAEAYDWPALRARLATAMAQPWSGPPYPFYYPPTLLLILAPVAALPTALAAAVWIAIGAATVALGFRASRPSADAFILLAAAPAGFFCLCVGQTALLTTGLMLLGLRHLDRRPILAGALFALLAFKPQFGPLLLVVLAATGRWRAIVSGGLVLAVLGLASALVFGLDAWIAFVRANAQLGALSALPLEKSQSLYGLFRDLGLGASVAGGLHAALALALVVFVIRLWRSDACGDLKAAALILGTYLITPYACVYDLLLTEAAALLILPFALKDRWGGVCLTLGCAAPLLALVQIAPYGGPAALLILAALARALVLNGRKTVMMVAVKAL